MSFFNSITGINPNTIQEYANPKGQSEEKVDYSTVDFTQNTYYPETDGNTLDLNG